MSESEPKAEIVLPADAVYLIFFDDRDCPPQIIVGGAAARHRFKEVSISWNAHLFGKIESNCRDDKYHANNIQLAASPQVPLTAQEWLTKDEVDAVIRALSPDHDGSDFEAECPACTAYRKLAGRLVASHPAEMMDTEVQTAHVTSPVPSEINKTALPSGYSREDVAALAGSLVARMEARLSAMHESGAGSVAISKGLAFDLHYVLKLASELGEPIKLRIDATPLDQQAADSWMAGAFAPAQQKGGA